MLKAEAVGVKTSPQALGSLSRVTAATPTGAQSRNLNLGSTWTRAWPALAWAFLPLPGPPGSGSEASPGPRR